MVHDNKTMLEGVDTSLDVVIDVDDKITALEEEINVQNRIGYISRTTKNLIGEYSNYASVYLNRIPQSPEMAAKYRNYVDIISVVVGKSIDYAKTGVLYPMPRVITKFGRPLPYFMKYRSPYYARQKLAKSYSNMNRLAWDIEKWEKQARWQKNTGFNWRIMIDDGIQHDTEYDRMFAEVEALFLNFCKETSALSKYQALVRRYTDPAIKKQYTRKEASEYMADWGDVYERYKEEAAKICSDQKVLADIAVRLCFEKYHNKGMKFPWIVAGDGLCENICAPETNMMPMRDPDGEFVYLGKHYRIEDVAAVMDDSDAWEEESEEEIFD